jgi:uncharacterized protein
VDAVGTVRELPEVGDRDKPKLVFFFDEAHLLFNEAPQALLEKVEQVVRLIRSKGVGVYFVTQNPLDVPDKPCSASSATACSMRCAPSRRATRRRSTRVAETLRANPKLDVEAAITRARRGRGAGVVARCQGHAVRDRARLGVPAGQPDRTDHAGRAQEADCRLAGGRRLRKDGRPRERLRDAQGARRKPAAADRGRAWQGRAGGAPAPAGGGMFGGLGDILFGSTGPRGGRRDGVVDTIAKSAARSVGSSIAREITRGVLGSLLGGSRRR